VLVETEDETQVPALHHAVMIETATAIADRIGDLVDELRMAYGQLCMLGLVIEDRGLSKGFNVKLPPTPFGQAGF
jgi:hypothetical protein